MKESIESRRQRFKEMLSKKEVTMEMLNSVYFSLNSHSNTENHYAKKYKMMADSCYDCRTRNQIKLLKKASKEEGQRCLQLSHNILDTLLNPTEIHIINGESYIYYDYDKISFYKKQLKSLPDLPVRQLNEMIIKKYFPLILLDKKFCKQFYKLIMSGNYQMQQQQEAA